MNCALLIRPAVNKKRWTRKVDERVLPADLAAAYACYHENLLEQRKLEDKLHTINLETKQMQRNYLQQRELLERELKKSESHYWSCHRVFSAETLITDSDSYRKRFYNGPQPTKAKLPRRKLERLGELLRSLRAEDDLETLLKFQRCARYASRKETPGSVHRSVSSLTLSRAQGNIIEFDSWELLHAAELSSGSSTDSGERLSDLSLRKKRIRSAPAARAASGKRELGERNKGRYSTSACPTECLPKMPDEASKYSTPKAQESSGIPHSSDRREKGAVHVKFAWVEKEKEYDTVDNVSHDPLDGTGLEQSRDSSDQSSGTQDLLPTLSQHEISRGSGKDSSSHQEHSRGESPVFKDLQRRETEVAELESSLEFSSTSQEQAYIEKSAVEEEGNGDEYSDRIDSESTKTVSAPNEGWALIRRIYLDNQETLAPNSSLEYEDSVHVSDRKEKGRGFSFPEPPDYDSFARPKKPEGSHGDDKRTRRQKQLSQLRKEVVTSKNRRGSTLSDTEGSKSRMRAEKKASSKMSIALPKSSLHGLASQRKSLTPRPRKNARAVKTAAYEPEVRNNTAKRTLHVKMLSDDFGKTLNEQNRCKDAQRKRKVSIFKRTCLSEALAAGQTQVENQLRNRVQGFLGTIDNVEETGEEELQ